MAEKLPLIYEVKDEIREAIDAYEWKHSWHLEKDQWGYTDWNHPNTLKDCKNVLEEYATKAMAFAVKCDRLRRIVDAAIRRRESAS